MRLRVMMWRTDPKTVSHNLYEPVQSKCTRASHKSRFIRNLQEKGHAPEVSLTLCTCAVEIQMDMPEQPFYARNHLKKKCRAPDFGCTLRASLHNRNAHGHVRTAILCEKLPQNSRAPEVRCTFCAGLPKLPAGKASPSIFRDTFCPAKPSISCIRYKNACRARLPLKSENGRCEDEAFVRDFPQNLTGEDVKTKLSRARLRSKTETGRCENEAFVRDFPQKVKAEDVKTKLSCETSLKFRKCKL